MRVSITCEECGERHRLERRITTPGPIWIVCHSCEMPLQAVLEDPIPGTKVEQPTPSAWASLFDTSPASS